MVVVVVVLVVTNSLLPSRSWESEGVSTCFGPPRLTISLSHGPSALLL
mgnify:CR=1 FL=1